jgi:hypothetical protein
MTAAQVDPEAVRQVAEGYVNASLSDLERLLQLELNRIGSGASAPTRGPLDHWRRAADYLKRELVADFSTHGSIEGAVRRTLAWADSISLNGPRYLKPIGILVAIVYKLAVDEMKRRHGNDGS